MRSLGSGEPNYVLGRQTLGSNRSPEIEMLIDKSYIVFNEQKWNRVLPNLEIFDSYFINNNVYSGNDVSIDHRRNLHYFVLGQEGVKYANDVNRCDRALKSISERISKKEAEVQKNIIGNNIDILQFVDLLNESSSIKNIDYEIASKKKAISALEQSREILSKKQLDCLSLPMIPRNRLEKLLVKNLDNISEGGEKITCNHISVYLDDQGENWIEAGLNYIKTNQCPFCEHNISDSPLIKAYRSYFDTTYKSFKKEINDFSNEMSDLLSENRLLDLQRIITTNDLLADFWRKYIDIDYELVSFREIQDVWIRMRSLIDDHLNGKKLTPLESMQMKSNLLVALRQYNFVNIYILINIMKLLKK